MKKFAIISILGLVFCAHLGAQNSEGIIFVRTLRNDAQIKNSSEVLSVGDNRTANLVEVKTPEGAFASFALSNQSAVLVLENSDLKIEKFEHSFIGNSAIALSKDEPVPSLTILELIKGDIVISRANPRPKSVFAVKTKFGTFQAAGKNMRVKVDENSVTAYAFDCAFNYIRPDLPTPEYIGIGYGVSVKFDSGKIKSSRFASTIDINSENKKLFSAANDAWRSTIFVKDASANIRGKRAMFKDYWIRTPDSKF